MTPILLWSLSGLLYMLYSFSFLIYIRHLLKGLCSISRIGITFFSIAVGVSVHFLSAFGSTVPELYTALSIIIFLGFYLLLNCSIDLILFCSIHFMLHIVCARGFCAGILAFALRSSLFEIMRNEQTRFIGLFLSVLMLFIINIIYSIFPLQDKLMYFFRQKHQLRFAYYVGVIMLTYQLFCAEAFYRNLRLSWFTIVQFIGSMLILFCYYSLLNHAVKTSVWVSELWSNTILEKQLELQLVHYHTYEKSYEDIKILKHDFPKSANAVCALLQNGGKEQALILINEMREQLKQSSIPENSLAYIHPANTVLQELEQKCAQDFITYSAKLTVTVCNLQNSFEYTRALLHLSTIALNACQSHSVKKKFIYIHSSLVDGWLTLWAEFSAPTDYTVSLKNNLIDSASYKMLGQVAADCCGLAAIHQTDNVAKLMVHMREFLKEEVAK